eukprot:2162565-Rhodomonas_salina.1
MCGRCGRGAWGAMRGGGADTPLVRPQHRKVMKASLGSGPASLPPAPSLFLASPRPTSSEAHTTR